jgi:hypothetical protein
MDCNYYVLVAPAMLNIEPLNCRCSTPKIADNRKFISNPRFIAGSLLVLVTISGMVVRFLCVCAE